MNDFNQENKPLLLTVPEVAKLLSLSVPTARRRVAEGVLPSIRIGGNVRVSLSALEAWIDSQSENKG